MCACAATRAVEGGVGWLSCWWRRRVWFRGPSGEAGPFTSAHKMAAAGTAVLAALFVGDNGPKSKTDSLLRGNAKPASELVK